MSQDSKKSQGIKEIAKLANVSIGTVDRVIHNRPGVSLKTKEAINKIIKEVGYQPNPIARRLAGFNTTYEIAVIIPGQTDYNPYWSQHLAGIKQAQSNVRQFGVEIETIYFDQADEKTFKKAVNQFLSNGFRALVLVPIFQKESQSLLKECQVRNIPVVCIDTDIKEGDKLSFIGQNAYESGRLAGKMMSWNLDKNDKVLITHITRHKDIHFNFQNRENGFKDYLTKEFKLPEENIIQFKTDGVNSSRLSKELEQTLLAHDNITGVYCPNTRGFKVAEALKKPNLFLIGYDLVKENVKLLKTGKINILISQQPEKQCLHAIDILYKKIVINQDPNANINVPLDILLKENVDYYLENLDTI